jgi:hypothetical protein
MPTTTLSPTADGVIFEGSPGTSYGTDTTMSPYQSPGEIAKGCFTFNLASVPAGTVTAASLLCRQTSNGAGTQTVRCSRLSTAYADTSTWTSHGGLDTTPQSEFAWISGDDGAGVRRAIFSGQDLIDLIDDARTNRSNVLSISFYILTGFGVGTTIITVNNATVDERPILEIETSGGVIGGGGATGNAKAIPLHLVLP